MEAAQRSAQGELSSQELVSSSLDRIAERDEAVKAWAISILTKRWRRLTTPMRRSQQGPLHGIPVGIKDIIDVAGMPTGFNSPIYPDYVPEADAACVAMIRKAGGSHSRQDGERRNSATGIRGRPGIHTIQRARRVVPPPGSAAAVGRRASSARSIGTQTSGSIVRPAAYCECRRLQAEFRRDQPRRGQAAVGNARYARAVRTNGRRRRAVPGSGDWAFGYKPRKRPHGNSYRGGTASSVGMGARRTTCSQPGS